MLINKLTAAFVNALIVVSALFSFAVPASGSNAFGQDNRLGAKEEVFRLCAPQPMPLIPGYLDQSFGDCGVLIKERETPGAAVAVQPDGKIVTFNAGVIPFNGGLAKPGTIHRFNTDGSIDRGFGQSGQVTLKGNQHERASGVLQPDGKIVAASGYFDGELHNYLERFLPDGKPDRSFGSGGVVETLTILNQVAIDPAGDSILVTGAAAYLKTDECSSLGSPLANRGGPKPETKRLIFYAAVERYNEAGQPDRSFGKDGSGQYVTPYCDSSGKDIAFQPDGKIVVVGHAYAGLPNGSKVLVLRFTRKGSLDRGFGENGRVIHKFGKDEFEVANGVVVQDGGGIVVVGLDGDDTGGGTERSAVVIARFTEDGTLDRSFGPKGNITRWGAYSRANDVILNKDGKLVVAGAGTNGAEPHSVAVARFEANGMPDKGFGANGVSITAIEGPKSRAVAIALQPFDGKIVVTGSYGWADARLLLARYQGRR